MACPKQTGVILQPASEYHPWWTPPGWKLFSTTGTDVLTPNGRNHGSSWDYNLQKLCSVTEVLMLEINE